MNDISDALIVTMNKSILGVLSEEPTTRVLSLENIEEDCLSWLKSLPDMMWARFPNMSLEEQKYNAKWLAKQIERLYNHVAGA